MPCCIELNKWPAVIQAVQIAQPLRSVQNVEHKHGFFNALIAAFLNGRRFGWPLYAMLFAFTAPWLAWSHDPSAAQKAKGAERREVRIPIEDFTLTDQTSRPFKFQSLRGKVAIIAFAYTTCPDVCPLITAAMRQAQEGLTEGERALAYFVTITTDPEIDTPQVMAAYAKRYGVDLVELGLSHRRRGGPQKNLEELRRRRSAKSARSLSITRR